jgi:hypothetical protein
MLMLRLMLCLLVACTSGGAIAAEPQYMSQKGTWMLNKAESKIPPGTFTPIDTPMEITVDDGNIIKFTIYVMSTEGLKPSIVYEGAYDGRPYPFTKGTTLSYVHLSPTSFKAETKSADGSLGTDTVTFTNGGAKMRYDGKRTEKSGKTYEYVEVWDKLQ